MDIYKNRVIECAKDSFTRYITKMNMLETIYKGIGIGLDQYEYWFSQASMLYDYLTSKNIKITPEQCREGFEEYK